MQITILLTARCVICGCSNRGTLFTSGRPGMRSLRLRVGPSLALWPPTCVECGHPTTNQPDHERLDPETIAELTAWQDRQRAKRKGRAA